MFRKILLAIDIFDGSKAAFNKAISLATALDANLMLLHVLSANEKVSPEMPIFNYYTQLDELLRKNYERECVSTSSTTQAYYSSSQRKLK